MTSDLEIPEEKCLDAIIHEAVEAHCLAIREAADPDLWQKMVPYIRPAAVRAARNFTKTGTRGQPSGKPKEIEGRQTRA
jgi:hypothetical protein